MTLGERVKQCPTTITPTLYSPYPYHLAHRGDFDICGFKRPQSYYRDLLWGVRTTPFIGVLDPQHYGRPLGTAPHSWEPVIDSWTFPGEEGKPTQVDVYAIDDEVELIINGVSVGRKPVGAASQNKATFQVSYQPGTIEAVGYTGGKETTLTSLQLQIDLTSRQSPSASIRRQFPQWHTQDVTRSLSSSIKHTLAQRQRVPRGRARDFEYQRSRS